MNESRDAADPAPIHDAVTVPPSQQATQSVGGTAAPPTVAGYEILGELGRGGMGVVYRARQVGLNRMVALKMILSGGHAGEAERARFKAEAEAVARLLHPNIVQIYEVGESGGCPFFSLEYVDGGSLAGKLDGTPWRPRPAAGLVETLARAVHAAHKVGVVHRDLKPANVLMTAEGAPKVTDFGLAKKLGDAAGLTQEGAVLGTPSYMAPEQAGGKSKDIGPSTDVYALGAILYELLTGRPPFRATTPLDTILQVVGDEPVPPRQLQPQTPSDIETICLKCLQKDPKKRYASAEALAEDVARFLDGQPITARPVHSLERAAKWVRRRPAVAAAYGLLVAALVMGLGGGGATWLWRRAEQARNDAETAQHRAEAAEGEASKARDDVKSANRQLTLYSYADQINLAQREWDAGHFQQARELLQQAGELQEQLTPGRRPWEWDYLNRLFNPQPTLLQGSTGGTAGPVSPDGSCILTRGADGIRLWDAASGKPRAVLKPVIAGLSDEVRSVTFSPDGGRVAVTTGKGSIQLWDATSGKPLSVVNRDWNGYIAWAFSPDGSRLGTMNGDQVRVWDVASGKQLAVVKEHSGAVLAGFSPDGRRLLTTSSDKTFKLWDAASGALVAVLEGATFAVVSPDGCRVATANSDGTARLWDAVSGARLGVLRGPWDLASVSFSPDGRRIATAGRSAVHVWDALSLERIAILPCDSGGKDVVFSPDGSLVATPGFGQAMVWDASSGKQLALLVQGESGESPDGQRRLGWISVSFSPDGRRVATTGGGKTRVWEAASGKESVLLEGSTNAGFDRDGRRIVTASEAPDKTVRVWDGDGDQLFTVLKARPGSGPWGAPQPLGPLNRVSPGGNCRVAFSPDGDRLVTTSGDGTARLWDAATGRRLTALHVDIRLSGAGEACLSGNAPDAQPRDSLIAACCVGQGGLLGMTPTTGLLRATPVFIDTAATVRSSAVLTANFTRDGARLATMSGDRSLNLRVWDATSGEPVAASPDQLSEAAHIALPSRFATTPSQDQKTAVVYDLHALVFPPKQIAVLHGATGFVLSTAVSPDGSRVVTASSDGNARVWDAASGEVVAMLGGHTDAVTGVCFSPEGDRIATVSLDRTMQIWDAATAKPLVVLNGHTAPIDSVSFSPDGRRIATASADGMVRLWIARESSEEEQKRWQVQQPMWHEEQADDAEKAGRWFAARFHLNRLLLTDPNNADLLRRRDEAEKHLKAP